MKKLCRTVLCFLLAAGLIVPVTAQGTQEEGTTSQETGETEGKDNEGQSETEPDSTSSVDFSDGTYWNNLCTGTETLSVEQQNNCSAYMQYIAAQTSSLSDKIAQIEAQRSQIASQIQVYADQIQSYQSQINSYQGQINDLQAQADALNDDIADLNGQIAVSTKKIEELESSIADTQEEIDDAEEKIKDRMVIQQRTMRLNPYLDVLMGASSFDEFVRIATGISYITDYDTKTMDDLSDLIDSMNETEEQIKAEKEVQEQKKQEIVDKQNEILNMKNQIVEKQNEILALRYQAQVVEEEYNKQYAELEAQGNRYAQDIAKIKEEMKKISAKLNEVATTPGWTYPVPGIKINPKAGTWHYATGGIHLGADFSTGGRTGLPVVAVGNGVILFSGDGCGYGNLGNWCSGKSVNGSSGSSGGGNQVYLLTKINGGLYAVKYLHLNKGSVIKMGTIVNAGDQIGAVGSSGNSSGPHTHVEVFYLGNEGKFSDYAENWDGDLSFGCGWGSAALGRLCENGVGAPCRVKPESLFGGK